MLCNDATLLPAYQLAIFVIENHRVFLDLVNFLSTVSIFLKFLRRNDVLQSSNRFIWLLRVGVGI